MSKEKKENDQTSVKSPPPVEMRIRKPLIAVKPSSPPAAYADAAGKSLGSLSNNSLVM